MKYVITESRLDTIIYDYIDKMFDVENINWHNPYYYDDDTGEEGEIETMVEYYIDDFDEGKNICFRWYDCEYFATQQSFTRKVSDSITRSRISKNFGRVFW